MYLKTRRVIGVVTAVLLAMGAFAGCAANGSSSPNGAAAADTASAAEATAAADNSAATAGVDLSTPYTVNFVVEQPQQNMSDQDAVESYLNDYLAQPGHLPNTKVHFTFYTQDQILNKVQLDAASGIKHDLISGAGMPAGALNAMVTAGVISPMTNDMLNTCAPDIMSEILPKYWPATTINNQIYAVPNPFVYSQPVGWVVQKTIAEKYNYDPSTYHQLSDLGPLLAQIKAGEPNMVPFLPDLGGGRAILASSNSYCDTILSGIVYDCNQNKLEWVFDDPTVAANCAALVDFYQKGYMPTNLSSLLSSTGGNKVQQTGTYAVMSDSGGYDPTAAKSEAGYGMPLVPVLISNCIIGTGKVQTVYVSLSATSDNPERAMMFENYLYKDKTFANYVGYGKPDLNFTYVSGEGTDTPTVQWDNKSNWVIWICWISPLWDQWDSSWNTTAALNLMHQQTDTAPVSPVLGFTPDTEPIKNQVASITQLYTTAMGVLEQGAEGDAAAYLAQLKDQANNAGLQQILDTLNEQISQWQSTNGAGN